MDLLLLLIFFLLLLPSIVIPGRGRQLSLTAPAAGASSGGVGVTTRSEHR
jgi:hypothetical protein